MVNVQRNQEWHDEWRNKAPQVEISLPTDDALAAAEKAMLDPSRNAADKKAAALRGVPQLMSPESTYSMWIPARELTATFSDTEVMTSLGSDTQSSVWSDYRPHLRDFKIIRNAGISFVCTDLSVVSKIGGQSIMICGRKFRIQPYSKYSSWYYVDLQRLPDDVTDDEIYDWFMEHGTPPVYLSPSRTIRGLKSRSRRVYFNHKSPPLSLMIDATTPLREINFGTHGFAVVNHRIRAYNRTVPPFIQELRQKRKSRPSPPPKQAKRTARSAPEEPRDRPTADDGDTSMTEADPDYVPESDGSDVEGSDGSVGSAMEDADGAARVRPSSVWSGEGAPKFPTGITKRTDRTRTRVLRAKQLVFDKVATPATETQDMPPSQAEYPVLSSTNPYEWLSTGDKDVVPQDHDLILWDTAQTPPHSVASSLKLPKKAERILNSAVITTTTEEVNVDQLCDIIESYLAEFSAADDADETVYTIQAQPSVHRFLLDTSTPENYQHLRDKSMNHAVLRAIAKSVALTEEDYLTRDQLAKRFPNAKDHNPQTILQNLCPSANEFWLQTQLAELDLALQIVAPSIYTDPLKVGALIQLPASALRHPMWLLWDDRTLGALVTSPLAEKLLAGPLPEDLRNCITTLQQAAVTASTATNGPSL